MLDWYASVLGMTPNLRSSTAIATEGSSFATGVWISNDRANHRIALVTWPGLKDDEDKHAHTRVQHVAFEYATIDDLLNSYTRLKDLGIEPVITADHGPTIAFYYEDPDGNSVELFVDNFGDWDKSTEFMRSSPEMAANPMGTFVDPEQMIVARRRGACHADLHQRAYAGGFPPAGPTDPRALL
jgi:catechol-2,3-dioxygenase